MLSDVIYMSPNYPGKSNFPVPLKGRGNFLLVTMRSVRRHHQSAYCSLCLVWRNSNSSSKIDDVIETERAQVAKRPETADSTLYNLFSYSVSSDPGVPKPQQPGVLDGGHLHARLRLAAEEERGGIQEGQVV